MDLSSISVIKSLNEEAFTMNRDPWIKRLHENRLMRSASEVTTFETTLALLAQNPDPSDLLKLHLILDDACEQPEVMFGLIHFLESFDLRIQVKAFVQARPQLNHQATEWSDILQSRLMNDSIARSVLEDELRSELKPKIAIGSKNT